MGQSSSSTRDQQQQPRHHSSILQSIKRRRRNARRTTTTTKSSWNPFRHRSSPRTPRPATQLSQPQPTPNSTSPSNRSIEQPTNSEPQPPPGPASSISPAEPAHPPTQPPSPIPPDPDESSTEPSQPAHPAPLPDPEADTSPAADRSAATGSQTPARRIYVQGMVVVRNVAETSASPSAPTQAHHQLTPSAAQPTIIPSDHPDPTSDPSDDQSLHPSQHDSSPQEIDPPHPSDSDSPNTATTGLISHTRISPSQVQLEQATMISRLLSAAAAATASSLLPYAIHADGTSIQNPPHDHQPRSRPRSASHPTDLPSSSARIRPASPTGNHPNLSQETSDNEHDSHAGLQTTLRDALRAAFGGALVNASPEPSPDQSPASSPHASSSNDHRSATLPTPALPASIPTSPPPSQSANDPLTEPMSPSPAPNTRGTGPNSSNTGLPSHRRSSSPHSAPDIPSSQDIPAATSESSMNPDLGANLTTHADLGAFEQFLRDLQADVGDAILTALGARQPAPVDPQELDERVRMATELPFAEEAEDELDETDEPDPRPSFNFFRMHRFEGVHPPIQAGPTTTDGADGARPALIPVLLVGVRSAPPNPLLGALERMASQVSPAAEPTGAGASAVGSGPSVEEDELGDEEEDAFWAANEDRAPGGARRSSESLGQGSIGLRRMFQDQSQESFDAWSDVESGQDTAADASPAPDPAVPAPTSPALGPDAFTPPHRSWLIFVLAGLYPESHPIFTAPSLFIPHGLQSAHAAADPSTREEEGGDRGGLMSRLRGRRGGASGNDDVDGDGQPRQDMIEEQLLDYETMLRLAELLGHNTLSSPFTGFPPKPPRLTLTQAQIDRSDNFKKFTFAHVRQHRKLPSPVSPPPPDDPQILSPEEMQRSDASDTISVLENTLEKCLICLDEYGDEDPVEILACTHMFHKACVDQWLVACAASCPVCRRPAIS
ncbi:hypothetical protein PTTG_27817 [Puccinia triticina 1-1 BBBD Race 1]|uniref:RING-type domain-containing protein n=1 Tax=Puccinia triticina (isolate 1-1 / race 1 (BBBD)) TaxID=630390 RepID=A0A180GGT3_PUCT1|nr:hypothetical protein PTTG_27817 [Puccinia triticina 1-1 BBBD Race 1]